MFSQSIRLHANSTSSRRTAGGAAMAHAPGRLAPAASRSVPRSARRRRSGRDRRKFAPPCPCRCRHVDNEFVGLFGHAGTEVVAEHPQRRLLVPALAGHLPAARGANHAGAGHRGIAHGVAPVQRGGTRLAFRETPPICRSPGDRESQSVVVEPLDSDLLPTGTGKPLESVAFLWGCTRYMPATARLWDCPGRR